MNTHVLPGISSSPESLPVSLVIHRGARQIGGSCVEMRCGSTRLIVDAGTPLRGLHLENEAEDREVPALLQVPGLFAKDGPPINAVLFSHSHGDHSGLLPFVRREIPICLTKGASQMLMIAGEFTRSRGPRRRLGKAEQVLAVHGRSLSIGNFRVTPFAVDHSGYGACAFVIEGGGRRIIYSGDLRMHGPRGAEMMKLLEHPLWQRPDALIMEGTHLGCPQSVVETEESLAEKVAYDMESVPGLALLMFSPQNVDRLRTLLATTRAAGRILMADPYTLFVLHCVWRDAGLPDPFKTSGFIRVWFPYGPSRDLRRGVFAKLLPKIPAITVTQDEITADPGRYAVVFRESMAAVAPRILAKAGVAIFSLWRNYELTEKTRALKQHLEALGIRWLHRHSSGHISHEDLLDFVRRVNPRRLIPIHTETGDRFGEFLPEVEVTRLADGERLRFDEL